MTTERDDPAEGQLRNAEIGSPLSPAGESDESLLIWLRTTADLLLAVGYPEFMVEATLLDAWVEYQRCKGALRSEDRRAFIGKGITGRLMLYRGTREPHGPLPRVHDVIRAALGLNALTPHARRALEMVICENRKFEYVAEELEYTEAYIAHLVSLSVDRVRAWMDRCWGQES
jgi:hypothetical protein